MLEIIISTLELYTNYPTGYQISGKWKLHDIRSFAHASKTPSALIKIEIVVLEKFVSPLKPIGQFFNNAWKFKLFPENFCLKMASIVVFLNVLLDKI